MLSLQLCGLIAFAYLLVAVVASPAAIPEWGHVLQEEVHALTEQVAHIQEVVDKNAAASVHLVFHSDDEHAAAHGDDAGHHTVHVNINQHGDDHHDDDHHGDNHTVHHYKDGHHEYVGHCEFGHVSNDFIGYAHMTQDKGETEAHIYFDVEYKGATHINEDVDVHFHEYSVHHDDCGGAGDEFHPNGPIENAFVGHLHIGADNHAHQWYNHTHLALHDYHTDGKNSLFGRSILVTHGANDEVIGCCNIGHGHGDHGSPEEVVEHVHHV